MSRATEDEVHEMWERARDTEGEHELRNLEHLRTAALTILVGLGLVVALAVVATIVAMVGSK
jgi:hypothetical protein